ncbi:hypothetical protein [Demequina sp. NBRC 110053]|uniref:hypothetical protein n=1 Tax=Demequina sp. NBRC 110053 TaxID=1570342 RepID=UPI000A05C79C|nr:hypothetical protein [Demequina sp. NBRC 110053]
MTRHSVDTADLTSLRRSLDDLATFLEGFERSASNHGSNLLAAWSGQASREFIGEVGVWSVGARLLGERAANLSQRADIARQSYEAAVEQAKEVAG